MEGGAHRGGRAGEEGAQQHAERAVLGHPCEAAGRRTGAEAHFRPEFINRLDDIVEFDPLSRDQIGAIVELQTERVLQRIAARGITVTLTDAAKQMIGNRSGGKQG